MSQKPRLKAGILGATGSVGQKLIRLLDRHPWFEITALAASARSAGLPYHKAAHWLEPTSIPEAIRDIEVKTPDDDLDCDFLFSALDSSTAREVEPSLARAGFPVISNASAFRMDPAVPLLVPDINPSHAELVCNQPDFAPGFIATNPNCATAGLVATLKPLDVAFGIEAIEVTTLQAVSGAGYPGVSALDIMGNIIPNIPGEEEKLEEEPKKILGRLENSAITPNVFPVSAQVTRVPTVDGHLLCVSVSLRRRADISEVRQVLTDYRGELTHDELPSAPSHPLQVLNGEVGPQPRLHADAGGGMTVTVGRLRPCRVLDFRYVALVHNTIRGAAGAAILNAELLASRGLLSHRSQAPQGSTLCEPEYQRACI
ncbi:MAG: aspartate-semialdehyde dehydrogenase [bacterium]|nr:aspartate-semialdehyde dehydrogenase [bacterium]